MTVQEITGGNTVTYTFNIFVSKKDACLEKPQVKSDQTVQTVFVVFAKYDSPSEVVEWHYSNTFENPYYETCQVQYAAATSIVISNDKPQ